MLKRALFSKVVSVVSLISFVYTNCLAMESPDNDLIVEESLLSQGSTTFNQDEIHLEDVSSDSSQLAEEYVDPFDKRKNLVSLKRTAIIGGVVLAAFAITAILKNYFSYNQTLAELNQPTDVLISSNNNSLSIYFRYKNCLTECGYTNPELLVGEPQEYYINTLLNETAFQFTEKCKNFNLSTLLPLVEDYAAALVNQSGLSSYVFPNASVVGHFIEARRHKHNGTVSVMSLMDVFQFSAACIAYESVMANSLLWGFGGVFIAAIPVFATIFYIRLSCCAPKKKDLLRDIHYD